MPLKFTFVFFRINKSVLLFFLKNSKNSLTGSWPERMALILSKTGFDVWESILAFERIGREF